MTLKDLLKLFIYGERVIIQGDSCGWCNEKLYCIYIDEKEIPDDVKPFLDNEIISVGTEMVESGYCCGELCENAIINIIIK